MPVRCSAPAATLGKSQERRVAAAAKLSNNVQSLFQTANLYRVYQTIVPKG